MEPNPVFVRLLQQKLQSFHVDDEAIYWALRDLIINNVPLIREETKKGTE